MSKASKRKQVVREAISEDFALPEEHHIIVRVLRSVGNNLHQVATPEGEEYLASMPTKFRKNIWIKTGDYVVVQPIPEGVKVKAEIVKIMNEKSIKYYKEHNVWPKQFADAGKKDRRPDYGYFVNANRIFEYLEMVNRDSDYATTSDSSDSSSESDVDSQYQSS